MSSFSSLATLGGWNVTQNNSVCLLFYVALDLSIMYKKNDNTTDMAKFPVPPSASVDMDASFCNASESQISLSFMDGFQLSAMFSINNESMSVLDTLTTTYNLSDAKTFPNATGSGSMTASIMPRLTLGDSMGYWMCNSTATLSGQSSQNLMVMMTESKIQAFNVMDNKFSGNMTECPQDMTTAAPTTTMTPTTATTQVAPTGPPEPPTSTYNVMEDEKTCLLLKAALQFTIPYVNKKNQTVNAKVNMPKESDNGTEIIMKDRLTYCGNDTSQIALSFFRPKGIAVRDYTDGWWFVMTMTKNKDSKKFVVSEIELNYILDNNFDEPMDAGDKKHFMKGNLTLFSTSVGNSYLCSKDQDHDLGGGVKLMTRDFQLEPFKGGNSTSFSTPEECSADDNTSDLVPIIVGCALAALVVIVLIAYLIGRRRSTKGYQTV